MMMTSTMTPREAQAGRSTLRILALDGGGILGAFTAGVLDGLLQRAQQDENRAARQEQRKPRQIRLLDYIDLMAGTSTGGIIAISLAMGASPAEVCEFYQAHGPKIFPRDWLGLRNLTHLLRYRYRPEPLREAIESVVGTRPLKAACCALVIPAVDVVAGKIWLFKTDHHPSGQWATPDVLAVDAAMATAAAPTYFPAHTISGVGTFVDGGLWAYSPTTVALTEAIAYLRYDLDAIRLLSISTKSVPFFLPQSRRLGGLIRWAKLVVDAMFRFQVEGSWGVAKSLLTLRGGAYHRIDHVAPQEIFSLDNAHMVNDLIELGRQVGHYQLHYDYFREHFLDGQVATLHRRTEAELALAP
jgi:patatin-like phospholipase/acyl hydrolase